MIKINMAVEASSHEELLEALKSAGPNVTSFYGEVVGGKPTSVVVTPVVEPEDIPEPEPVYDITEVREKLVKVREVHGTDAMREILRKYGVEKLPELDKAHYAAVMKEADECLQQATPD